MCSMDILHSGGGVGGVPWGKAGLFRGLFEVVRHGAMGVLAMAISKAVI